jgi:hypothetical protein
MTILMILACDYANSKFQHWVPILVILCDGERFEFLVYDSGTQSIHSSGLTIGVFDVKRSPEFFLPSVKKSKATHNLTSFFQH